jgi:outer membrane protein assembly factor BamB
MLSPAMRRLLLGAILFTTAALGRAQAKPDPIEGTWTGTVTAPQGSTEIGFAFTRGSDGRLNLAFNMPAMFTYNARLGPAVRVENDTYTLLPFSTRLRLEGDRLTGTFGLSQLPVELHRGGTFAAAPPPVTHPAPPKPRWTRTLSPTWASPIVADEIIYVGTTDGKFHAARVADGSEVWTWSGPNRIDGRAVVSGDTVYFVDGRMELVALNRTNGMLRWRFPLHDAALAGKPAPDNPTFNRRTAIPLVWDNVVYCGSSDGGLYAIGARSGQKQWRYEAKSPIFSGIRAVGETGLAFGCMDGSVVQLDGRTQTETARFKTGGGVVTTPLFTAGRVIVGSRDYMLYGFNAADGSVAWKFSYWFSWVESTPQLVDGVIYIGASDFRRVTALDPATGHAHWSTDVEGMCWGWPAVTADTVFIGTVAQNIPGTVIAHTGGVMALDRASGAVKWQYRSPVPPENSFGGQAGSLAIAGDCVIALGFDGLLTAWPVRQAPPPR